MVPFAGVRDARGRSGRGGVGLDDPAAIDRTRSGLFWMGGCGPGSVQQQRGGAVAGFGADLVLAACLGAPGGAAAGRAGGGRGRGWGTISVVLWLRGGPVCRGEWESGRARRIAMSGEREGERKWLDPSAVD